MKTQISAALTGVAAGLLLASAPLQAQEQMSEQEVRSYFDQMRQSVTSSVDAGDFDALLTWTREHIADDAVFSASSELYVEGERKSFAVVELNKQDMLQFGQMALGALSANQGRAIQDYSLEISVEEVTPIGADAARVAVSYTEQARLAAPTGATAKTENADDIRTGSSDAASEAGSGTTERSIEVRATAECEHLVRRGEAGGELVLGLSTCQARTEL